MSPWSIALAAAGLAVTVMSLVAGLVWRAGANLGVLAEHVNDLRKRVDAMLDHLNEHEHRLTKMETICAERHR
jgi:hypothetical protein